MARTSRYSHDERRGAVTRAFGGTSTPSAVARELGVHPATLYRWANDEPATRAATSSSLRLVRAVQELLHGKDYADITVEEVAEAAGVSLRTAFHHFESKRELFNAAIDDAATEVIGEMARRGESAEEPADPVEQLRLFLRVAAEAVFAVPQAHVLFRDVGVPPSDSVAHSWHTRFQETLERFLREIAAAGSLDQAFDPATAAQILSRAMRGIYAASFEGADPRQAILVADRLHRIVAPAAGDRA